MICIINSFLITFLAGMSTLVGALFIFVKIKEENINKFIVFSLSFSVAIMIGISITELIPISFFSIIYNYGVGKGQILLFFSLILGYIVIKILNKYMDKIKTDDLYKLGILSVIALIIHNIPEGIAVFATTYSNPNLGLKLALAIILHNIPEGISISVPVYYATKSKKKALLLAFIAGLAEPLGALITYIFLKDMILTGFIDMTLIFVGSLMITLSIKDIFPKAESYNEIKYIKYGFVAGILLIIINLFI